MFDKTAEALHRELLGTCPPDRSYRLADLKSELLPDPIGRYAADELRTAITAEVDRFDPGDLYWIESDDEVLSSLDRFKSAAMGAGAVPAAEWEAVLFRSVQRALEHAVTPRTGLVRCVFEGSNGPIEPDEIIRRISSFHTGLPLRAAVVRALKRGTAKTLDADAFRSLVDRVHDALTLDYARTDWAKEMEPIVRLTAAGGSTNGVPAGLAAALLEDLGETAAADDLRAEGDVSLDPERLLDLLAGPEARHEDAEEDDAEPASPEAEGQKAANPAAVPLWQRFQKSLNEPISPAARVQPEKKPPAGGDKAPRTPEKGPPASRTKEPISVEEEESQRPLWQKYRSSRSDDTGEVPVREIEVQILGRQTARARESFVTALFGGDEETYIDVLHELKQASSWSEASRVIAESVFKRFQINIYSEEAVAFTNAVEARFRVSHTGD